MNLNPSPLKLIREGKKTIELRLLDEKRKGISVGDTIVFVNTEDENDILSVTRKKGLMRSRKRLATTSSRWRQAFSTGAADLFFSFKIR